MEDNYPESEKALRYRVADFTNIMMDKIRNRTSLDALVVVTHPQIVAHLGHFFNTDDCAVSCLEYDPKTGNETLIMDGVSTQDENLKKIELGVEHVEDAGDKRIGRWSEDK